MRNLQEIDKTFTQQMSNLSPSEKEVVEIIDLAVIYGDSYGEKIIPVLERGLELSKKIGFTAGEVICRFNLSFFGSMTQGQEAKYKVSNPEEMRQMLDAIKHEETWYCLGLNLLGYFYWFRGEYDKGFTIAFEALRISEEQNNSLNLAWNHYALGVFYFDTKDLDNSEKYYRKSVEYFKKDNYVYGEARARNGLGSVFVARQDPKSALPFIEFAAGVYRDFEHTAGLSRALNDMALVEKSLGNYQRAIEILHETIKLRRSINHYQGLVTSLSELGEIFIFIGESGSALDHLKEALELSKTMRSSQKEARANKLLYEVYKKMGQTELALAHFENFYALSSKLMSDEAANNIRRIQSGFEKEKSEKEAEIERLKNTELKAAYQIIEQKNKDILDSIAYARRIQNSLMPTERYIEQKLNSLKRKK